MPGGVNPMMDSPRVTRELRLTHSAVANSRGISSARAHREGAERAVCALVDVAPIGQGGGDLPQTRRHTAPRTLKRKVPHRRDRRQLRD